MGSDFTPLFFAQGALALAPQLLGTVLVHEVGGLRLSGRIVEVEAYLPDDPACHASRGKTARNAPMFQAGGITYVYLIYGVHFCFNIVTGAEGKGEAVLIRALEPIEGLTAMSAHRRTDKPVNLCSGPGKLCQAMGFARAHNAQPLGGAIRLEAGSPPARILSDRRIGIRQGVECPYRFLDADSECLSRAPSQHAVVPGGGLEPPRS